MPPTLTAAEARGPAEPLLSVRDLSVVFELDEGTVRAVNGVSFDVRPGEVVGIVGESGCGKSVTMKAILQLIESPGHITRGEILYHHDDARPRIIDLARLAPRGALMLKDLDRPPPRQLLRAVDLAQIQHVPLHHAAASDPRVLDNAPIAMLLAILAAVFVPQEHDGRELSAHSWP